MNKFITFLFFLGFSKFGFAQHSGLSQYVNPMIGASTMAPVGIGKTFPGAATPFGMVQLSPNTIFGGDNGSGYSYQNKYIEGFAFTQMSGVGKFGDLGNFLVTPTTGPLKTVAGRHAELPGYRSLYDKNSEVAEAGYYAATLTDYHIHAEATAAPHSGIIRFTFPANAQSRIQIDLAHRVGGTSTEQYVEVVGDRAIQGWMKCTPKGGGWGNGADYTVYFYAECSKPLKNFGTWSAIIPDNQRRTRQDVESLHYDSLIIGSSVTGRFKQKQGRHLGFYTEFSTGDRETVLFKAGISFTSIEGARNNLVQEIPDWGFDKVRENTKRLWDKELSKITVNGGTRDQKVIFYTAMYHSMIDPRNVTDVNGQYTGGDGRVHTAKGFTKRSVFSGWDVFRSQLPLLTLIKPEINTDIISSLVELADQSGKGYLERWELLNYYTGVMIGNPAISVITDAYHKGFRNFDVNKAYQYAKQTSDKFGNTEEPHAMEISRTLEYAYTEWCMSQMAAWLGHPADVSLYAKRAQRYKDIFDTEKGWFRPKGKSGNWLPWPEQGRMKGGYTTIESNPYQQGWFVPQDVEGMTLLMGGREKVIADLVNFFDKTPADFRWNDYYNHANEPVHHIPFLFNRLGVPWLTQRWVRIICENAYQNNVGGLVGNDDAGQMSAWYVLAASGIAQICPGDNRYEIFSPVFDAVHIQVSSGKIFSLVAKNNSKQNIYIQSATLNGKAYNKCHIDYDDIIQGGKLELTMGDTPNKQWGMQ